MRLLALDAALETCSAAVLEDGVCAGVVTGGDSRQAAALLPPLIGQLVAAHGPADMVAVTVGPGSFTGLRAAIALAHGLVLGRPAALRGIGVPDALRDAVAGPVWIVLDVRRTGRVIVERDGAMATVRLDDPPQPPPGVVLAGNGALALAEALAARGLAVPAVAAPVFDAALVGAAAWRRRAAPSGPVQPWYDEPPQTRTAPPPRPAPA